MRKQWPLSARHSAAAWTLESIEGAIHLYTPAPSDAELIGGDDFHLTLDSNPTRRAAVNEQICRHGPLLGSFRSSLINREAPLLASAGRPE